MKKRLHYVFYIPVFFFIILLLSFSQAPDNKGIVIRDEAGRTVVIPVEPESVVSLSPSNTEILFAIGAGDMVVGVTEYCNYPPSASGITKVGGFSDVTIERIVALDPDIIFASHLHISKVAPALENLGFPVVVINPTTVSAVFTSITFVGQILKKESRADSLAADLRSRYNEITQLVGKKESVSVYWELSHDFWTIGKSSYLDDLITRAGGENIAKDLDAPWLQLSSEFILDANPGMIFLADYSQGVTSDELFSRPGWDALSAMKRNRVIEVEPDINDIVSRPGPRVIVALEYIAGLLHPELF